MDPDKAKRVLKRVRDLRILVVGDLILDRYLYGRVQRISREAPVPVVEVEGEEVRLGGAGNVASNLADLGVKTYLAGVVGEDRAGRQLRSLVESKGITPLIVSDSRPTTRKTRVVSLSQQLIRIDEVERSPLAGDTLGRVVEHIEESEVDGIIVSDYESGVITREVMEAVSKKGVFFAVDPRPPHRKLYRGADLMTPNEEELISMTDPLGEGEIEELALSLKEELEIKALVVTRGSKGMTLFSDSIKHFPARAREVYDVTGAGDTVVAVLTAVYLAERDWATACELANLSAGIVVGELGAVSVSTEEILEELKGEGGGVRRAG